MTRDQLAKVADGIAFDEMAPVQEIAARSLVAEIERRIVAEEAVAANLARLEQGLKVGDRIVTNDELLVEIVDLDPAPGKGRLWASLSGMEAVRLFNALGCIRAMVRGGATVALAADRSDVEGVVE